MKRLLIILELGIVFALAPIAHAATLTIAPSAGTNQVVISLNTEGESVNAIEAHLTFNPQEFSITDISNGGSVVNFWIEGPTFSNDAGTVDLSGIIPGGVTTANGTVLTLTLAPKGSASSNGFTIASAQTLLNDGKGTAAKLTTLSQPFTLAQTPLTETSSTQAPDAFTPEIASDPNIFNGQYFLVFATTDEHSGIDHYEVLEVPHGKNIDTTANWQTATSPYLLEDQTLASDIYVRAVDKDGNFRMVKLSAEYPGPSSFFISPYSAIFIGLVILLIGLLLLIWHKKRRSRR